MDASYENDNIWATIRRLELEDLRAERRPIKGQQIMSGPSDAEIAMQLYERELELEEELTNAISSEEWWVLGNVETTPQGRPRSKQERSQGSLKGKEKLSSADEGSASSDDDEEDFKSEKSERILSSEQSGPTPADHFFSDIELARRLYEEELQAISRNDMTQFDDRNPTHEKPQSIVSRTRRSPPKQRDGRKRGKERGHTHTDSPKEQYESELENWYTPEAIATRRWNLENEYAKLSGGLDDLDRMALLDAEMAGLIAAEPEPYVEDIGLGTFIYEDMDNGQASSSHNPARVDSGPKEQCISCGDEVSKSSMAHCPCDHDYCRECFVSLFELSMGDQSMFPPRCCRIAIPINDYRVFFTDEFVRSFRQRENELSTTDQLYCHVKTCSSFIPVESRDGEVGTCPSCSKQTCKLCNGPRHDNECPKDLDTEEVLNIAREQQWQRCQRCGRVVELQHGCNHITCVCSAQFCYVCGARWKTCECAVFDVPADGLPELPGVPLDMAGVVAALAQAREDAEDVDRGGRPDGQGRQGDRAHRRLGGQALNANNQEFFARLDRLGEEPHEEVRRVHRWHHHGHNDGDEMRELHARLAMLMEGVPPRHNDVEGAMWHTHAPEEPTRPHRHGRIAR